MPRRNSRSSDSDKSRKKTRADRGAGPKRRRHRRSIDESEFVVPVHGFPNESEEDDLDFLDEDFDARIDYGDDFDDDYL